MTGDAIGIAVRHRIVPGGAIAVQHQIGTSAVRVRRCGDGKNAAEVPVARIRRKRCRVPLRRRTHP